MSRYADLLKEAEELQPGVVELRRAIHREPELGLSLPATRDKVLAAIEGLPLEVVEHEKTTGIVATLRGAQPGPTLSAFEVVDALDVGVVYDARGPLALVGGVIDMRGAASAHAVAVRAYGRTAFRAAVVLVDVVEGVCPQVRQGHCTLWPHLIYA